MPTSVRYNYKQGSQAQGKAVQPILDLVLVVVMQATV